MKNEIGRSLRMRRIWRDDTGTELEKQPEDNEVPPEPPGWASDPKAAYEEVQRARDEAKKYRLRLRDLEDFKNKIDADNEQAKVRDLADKKKYDEALAEYERQLNEEKQRNAQMALNALKRNVADEVGLPSALAERLSGKTEEEIRADAQKLLEIFPADTKSTMPRRQNTTTAVPGGQPPKETAAERWARRRESPFSNSSAT